MRGYLLIITGLIFLLGGMAGLLINELLNLGQNIPVVQKPSVVLASPQMQKNISSQSLMPKDRIPESKIHVYPDKVVLDISSLEWARYTATKSMVPFLDAGANGLEMIPKSPHDLQVGDIIAYRSEYSDGVIIHRIISMGHDKQGWYAIMKGDNNPFPDPGRVRFNQTLRVLVGILY